MGEVSVSSRQYENQSKTRLVLRTLVHLLYVFINYGVALYGTSVALTLTEKQLKVPEMREMHKYLLCFFTNWNYMFQTVFLSLSLLYDALQWLDKHQSTFAKKLEYYRDVIFCGMVVPFTLFISTMFWCVYLIDRELVFPAIYDEVVPWWFNHCVHTNISVMLLVETLLQARRNPTNKAVELSLVGGIGVLYAIVYYSIYFIAGRWLYAVFGVMTWWQVCLYQCCIWASSFLFYYIQFPINRIFHREEEPEPKEDIKKNGERNPAFDPDWSLAQKERSHL